MSEREKVNRGEAWLRGAFVALVSVVQFTLVRQRQQREPRDDWMVESSQRDQLSCES